MLSLPLRPPRDWLTSGLALALGLGLSSALVVAALGLRWPVLAGALLPPLVVSRFHGRKRRQLRADAIAAGHLLDPWILQERLARIPAQLPREPAALEPWRKICADMEAIRALAARCAELDGTSGVSLLLLLEDCLDRIQKAAGAPPPGQTGAPASAARGWGDPSLALHLAQCRRHLARLCEEGQRFAQTHPGLPVLLPPLPSRFQP